MWRGRRALDGLAEDIRDHIAQEVEENIARGMSPDEARRQALLKFGNVALAREDTRAVWSVNWLEPLGQDAKYALRSLSTSPGLATVAILTLALGIGSTTAVFSVMNSLLLRPLPVVEPERLVTVSTATAIERGFTAGNGMSYAMWDRLQQRVPEFGGAFTRTPRQFNLAPGGERDPVDGLFASGGFFTTLGVQPVLGRLFSPVDDVRGGGPDGAVAVISHRLWQRRFGGQPDAIGAPLSVDGVPFTIIGVAPPEFFGIDVGTAFDLFLPLGTEPLIAGERTSLDVPQALVFQAVLRLGAEQSLESANAALRARQAEILGFTPDELAMMPPWLAEPFTLVPAATGTTDISGLRRVYTRPLFALFVLAALVLLVACVNIANLLLARATARQYEMGTRAALGASRARLARQSLVESLVLCAAAAALGVVLATWSTRVVVTRLSVSAFDVPVVLNLSPDWRVLLFVAGLAIATVTIFGAVPAWRATRADAADILKRHPGGPRAMERRQVRRTAIDHAIPGTGALVIAQVALSMGLVAGAGLLVRTLDELRKVPLGFDGDDVLVVEVDTGPSTVQPEDRLDFYQRLAEAVTRSSGVAGAAASFDTPLSRPNSPLLQMQQGRPLQIPVTPGWFRTYGIDVRAGRDFDARDRSMTPHVAIVNQAYARRVFPGRTAIGEAVDERTIVGVVSDAVFASPRAGVQPTVYVPLAQSAGLTLPGRTTVSLSVRSDDGEPTSLVPAVGAALRAFDPRIEFAFRSQSDATRAALARERLMAVLAGFFGTLGLSIASLGLYGITAYGVSRRRWELGVRLALGARSVDVIGLVVRKVMIVTGVGIVIGLAGAALVARSIEALLFGVGPLDPATLVSMAALLGVVSLTAAFVPAMRAVFIDPVAALRSE